jgi:hypothetical protein
MHLIQLAVEKQQCKKLQARKMGGLLHFEACCSLNWTLIGDGEQVRNMDVITGFAADFGNVFYFRAYTMWLRNWRVRRTLPND